MKLLAKIYIYNFIDNVNINEDKTDCIPLEFLQSQTLFRLAPFRINLKVEAFFILLCNLNPASQKYNRV